AGFRAESGHEPLGRLERIDGDDPASLDALLEEGGIVARQADEADPHLAGLRALAQRDLADRRRGDDRLARILPDDVGRDELEARRLAPGLEGGVSVLQLALGEVRDLVVESVHP